MLEAFVDDKEKLFSLIKSSEEIWKLKLVDMFDVVSVSISCYLVTVSCFWLFCCFLFY